MTKLQQRLFHHDLVEAVGRAMNEIREVHIENSSIVH